MVQNSDGNDHHSGCGVRTDLFLQSCLNSVKPLPSVKNRKQDHFPPRAFLGGGGGWRGDGCETSYCTNIPGAAQKMLKIEANKSLCGKARGEGEGSNNTSISKALFFSFQVLAHSLA